VLKHRNIVHTTGKGVGRKISRDRAMEKLRPRNSTNKPPSILSVASYGYVWQVMATHWVYCLLTSTSAAMN